MGSDPATQAVNLELLVGGEGSRNAGGESRGPRWWGGIPHRRR